MLQTMKDRRPLRQTLGAGPAVHYTGDFKIRCVCRVCNNGWMSELEASIKPLLALLAGDVSVEMNAEQQLRLTIWAAKTAMVTEATKPQKAVRFYQPEVRKAFNSGFSIPYNTRMWMGRYNGSGLFAAAAEIQYNLARISSSGFGSVTTMIVGHLVLQVLSLNFPAETQDHVVEIPQRIGDWDQTLFPLWPFERSHLWPPALSFGNDPDRYPLRGLHDRWRVEAIA